LRAREGVLEHLRTGQEGKSIVSIHIDGLVATWGLRHRGDRLKLDSTNAATPCLTPGATVQFTYRTRVPLPLVPFVTDEFASIPVTATHTQTVDQYSQVRP
jgi:hypothetical protein